MKISNSKKELARIISENGGWREGAEFAVQGQETKLVGFSKSMPYRRGCGWFIKGEMPVADFKAGHVITNWHQTILSRDEYFRLYPAQDDDGWIEWKGGECPVEIGTLIDVKYRDGHLQLGCRSESRCDTELYATTHWGNSGGATDIIAYRLHKPEQVGATEKLSDEAVSAAKDALMSNSIEGSVRKPTIEHLAADYRNLLDFARRKQEEADAAKADSDAKLKALELAGEALGLLVSPITAKQEAELVIEFKVGDEVECVEPNINRDKYIGMIGILIGIDERDPHTPYLVDFVGCAEIWCHEVKFIRRP